VNREWFLNMFLKSLLLASIAAFSSTSVVLALEKPLVFNASAGYGLSFNTQDGNAFSFSAGVHYFPVPSWGIGFQPEFQTVGLFVLPLTLTYRTVPGGLFGFGTRTALGIGLATGYVSGLAYVYEGALDFPVTENTEFYIGPKLTVAGSAENSLFTTPRGFFALGLHSGFRF
jgi:hypothetical protein